MHRRRILPAGRLFFALAGFELFLQLFFKFDFLLFGQQAPVHFQFRFADKFFDFTRLRKIGNFIQPEVPQELRRRTVQQRTSRCGRTAHDGHQIFFQQCPHDIIGIDTANEFHFGLCDRLFVRNDSERFDCGGREFAPCLLFEEFANPHGESFIRCKHIAAGKLHNTERALRFLIFPVQPGDGGVHIAIACLQAAGRFALLVAFIDDVANHLHGQRFVRRKDEDFDGLLQFLRHVRSNVRRYHMLFADHAAASVGSLTIMISP